MSRRSSQLPIEVGEIDLRSGHVRSVPTPHRLRLLVRDGDAVLGELVLEAGEATDADAVLVRCRALYYDGTWRGETEDDVPPAHEVDEISIVVCTRDRPDLLVDCLEAALRCDPAPREIIVVDSASVTQQTRAVAERAGVTYRRLDEPGLDRARNHGWQQATGGIVLYVDDDARVDHRAVSMIAASMLDPEVALVTGLVLPAEIATDAQRRFEHGNGMSKGFRRRVFNEDVAPIGLAVWSVGVGALMAIRRSTLVELDGFDPCLDVGTATRGAGDLDIFYRILASGATAVYEPSCVARHLHRRDRRGLWRQMVGYGYGYTALVEKQRIDGRLNDGQARREVVRWHAQRRGWQLARAVRHRQLSQVAEIVAEGVGSLSGARAYRAELRRKVGATAVPDPVAPEHH